MNLSTAVKTNVKPAIWKVFLKNLIHLPWTWRITLGYLTIMLFIPIV
ncbi:MAG: sulfate ABC transporter permease subunit CysT, partial [Dolichospermum sp.]